MSALRVAVLVSGAGTNLQALLESVHGVEAEIVAVASDQASPPAFKHAAEAGVEFAPFTLIAHRADRALRDETMARWLVARDVQLVVLAGYMSVLSAGFLERFPEAVVNVHPSLLPAFCGLNAVKQALDYGVTVFGVTVHFVDDGVDTGAVIVQSAIDLTGVVDPDEVHARLRPLEHDLLPRAVRLIARGALSRDPRNPRRIRIDAPPDPPAA